MARQPIVEERSEVDIYSGTFLVLSAWREHRFLTCSVSLTRGPETRVPHGLRAHNLSSEPLQASVCTVVFQDFVSETVSTKMITFVLLLIARNPVKKSYAIRAGVVTTKVAL